VRKPRNNRERIKAKAERKQRESKEITRKEIGNNKERTKKRGAFVP
jgi:hypothetical protein